MRSVNVAESLTAPEPSTLNGTIAAPQLNRSWRRTGGTPTVKDVGEPRAREREHGSRWRLRRPDQSRNPWVTSDARPALPVLWRSRRAYFGVSVG
jgi:hypothetical protein